MKKCNYCNKTLVQKQDESDRAFRSRLFCNRRHQEAARNKRRRDIVAGITSAYVNVCQVCGKDVPKKRGRTAKYCSIECRIVADNKRRYYRRRGEKPPENMLMKMKTIEIDDLLSDPANRLIAARWV